MVAFIRLKPGHAEAYVGMGSVYSRQGRWRQAEGAYRDAIRLSTRSAEAHCGVARAQSETGQRQAAEESYRRALRLDPKLARAYCGLGSVLYREDRLDEATAAFERAIEVDPSAAGAYYYLGYIEGYQRRWSESVEAFRHAVRLDPALAVARRALIWAQAGMHGHGVFGFTLLFQRVGELDWRPAFGWLSTYQYGVLVWGPLLLFPGLLAWRLGRPIRGGRRTYRRIVFWGFGLWPVFLFWSVPHRCVLGSPAYYVALAPTSILALAWLLLGLGRIVLPAVRTERERDLHAAQEQPHREAVAERGTPPTWWTVMPSTETEPVRLCRIDDPTAAEIVRANLAQAGIPSVIHLFGPITGYFLAHAAAGATDDYAIIFVPRNRLDEARRLVAELESGPVVWPDGMEPDEQEKPR